MVKRSPGTRRLPRILIKDAFRDIKKNFGQFLSIFLIVAIGVGFFAGVGATGPDMKLTADTYFNEQNLSDMRIVGSLGLTEKDVAALEKLPQVQAVVPGHFVDTILEVENSSTVVKVIGHDFLSDKSQSTVNQPVLLEGRLPQGPGECVAEVGETKGDVRFAVGEVIHLSAGSVDTDLSDTLHTSSFTVVGLVQSPYYISIDRGTSLVGNGSVGAFILVPNESFCEEVYSEIYLRFAGSEALSNYSDEYKNLVKDITATVEELGEKRASERLGEVTAEAYEEIDKAKAELADAKADGEKELADAAVKISDAEIELADGEKTLAEETQKYHDAIAEAEEKLADGRKDLEQAEEDYKNGLAEYEKGQREFDNAYPGAMAEIAEGQALLKENEKLLTEGQALFDQIRAITPTNAELAAVLADPAGQSAARLTMAAKLTALAGADPTQSWAGDLAAYLSDPGGINPTQSYYHAAVLAAVNTELDAQAQTLQDGWVQLAAGKKELAAGLAELDSAESQLSSAREELQKGRKELDDGWQTLTENEQTFLEEKADGWQKILDARQELADGKIELADGKKEYEDGLAEFEKEIADAEEKIADAEAELADLGVPKWYLFDREDIPGNADFGNDAERISAIAQVFPVFFLLVAALVCLTTMTRIVEEQRTEIGTLKALGYTNAAIATKFLIWALTATIAGSLAGLIGGMKLFPTVIYGAYGILYTMTNVIAPFRMSLAVTSVAAAAVMVCAVVIAVCRIELSEQPAHLMRPKAPKSGRRVLLERVGFIWNRLNFTKKVTVRNLLRYKKRMLMTVLGIAGCAALMLTGFRLYDAIWGIINVQFNELYHYDLITVFDEETPPDQLDEIHGLLFENSEIKQSIYARQQSLTVKDAGGRSYSLSLMVPADTGAFDDFITLRTRKGQEPISLEKEGAVLTEKMAGILGVSPGDSITVTSENEKYTVPVAAICEHYAGHYLYLTPQVYADAFGKDAVYNLVQSQYDESPPDEDALAANLIAIEDVYAVSSIGSVKDQFFDMIQALNSVIWVLIGSAGLLAFVVLYNLSNINISERIREIATIKVLGFYDKEVSSYITRENFLLTLLGVAAGMVLGIFLSEFVITTAETDLVMFFRTMNPLSFVYAAALTVVFSVIVSIVLHFRLKKVSMVESLKSIE